MLKKELIDMLTFYAISPIHAGSGNSTSAVDLPIQRERHTNWPHIQASAVKGAMRAHFRNFSNEQDSQLINFIFGLDLENDKEKKIPQDENENKLQASPGAIAISDAKLLAFPVRSNIAPFIWVTSPTVIKRLINDLKFMGVNNRFDNFDIEPNETESYSFTDNNPPIGKEIIIEDAVVQCADSKQQDFIRANFPDLEKLYLISDKMYKYVAETCTEIQTQIKIDSEKGTAQDGGLRYQELLPADSFLYSVIYYSKSILNELQADAIRNKIKNTFSEFIQIGGDETLGRGICKVNWINNGGNHE